MKDKKISNLIKKEEKRQREGIELIPSENYASSEVRKVLSSYYVNKYSEGYPKKRYYGGNENVDQVEILCQERAKELFKVPFANVQPYSGSPANLAVYLATCHPGDVVSGQALIAGGHLTHGHHVSATGIYYKTFQYGLIKEHVYDGKVDDLFDYEQIKKIAKTYQPKLIWVGATAYPLIIHFEKFAKIADEIGAYLAADIAHIAGLIAAGVHPSPVPYVHIVTTTTHKTLRGPRGAMIMVTEKGIKKDPDLPDKINKAVFPGLQGGPHDNQTASIAVALYEASQPSFKRYARQIVKNAKLLAKVLVDGGLKVVGGKSENHLILVSLAKVLGPGGGIFAQKALDLVGLTLNKNTVPDEPSSPFYPSGIRLGTPAATTRGMKEKEIKVIGKMILEVIDLIKPYRLPTNKKERKDYIVKFEKEIKTKKEVKELRQQVKKLALRFPIP
ncbi:serine hydroxymethyltransferase [Candidatus Roizmanbacteria bacterium CG_4_10_14_3_um_filter_33_21]|uniref:Serine hydroxymethyltransferase n=2 Tax=Candidatus Roizmaniibacteriota TaxID=1752723 RepID=A0A2M8F1L9_9BACT|nr:MAG: serine hydroxymethyltransferase [Candidatus Roizmanbacteria bacterium CG_4_10_14_3_um_filter_33_21]PJC33189.1 MAG: serine hydroxymethyltransferase [Candidatus Roizmanbacteria bacterium CG_4_9_14_0_2_um_filter_35_15]